LGQARHDGPVVRDAVPGDVGKLVDLVRQLARYERSEAAVEATEEDFRRALFAPAPVVFALVAGLAGDIIGMAVYFVSFSTWTGRHGLYLEDLFVVPQQRSRGVGRALLGALAARAVERGWARLEWAVLDWNQPAIDFYRSLGAVPADEWTTFRLSGPALAELGSSGREAGGLGRPARSH
jgi:GNAT superfamily N-acetyltransferase